MQPLHQCVEDENHGRHKKYRKTEKEKRRFYNDAVGRHQGLECFNGIVGFRSGSRITLIAFLHAFPVRATIGRTHVQVDVDDDTAVAS